MRDMTRLVFYFVGFIFFGITASAQQVGNPSAQRQSGFAIMSAETQAMQQNDLSNPAMLWVKEGENLWRATPGEGKKSCADCHGAAPESMTGKAAHYPRTDTPSGRPIDLAGQIQQCRSQRQGLSDWQRESRPLLAMTAYLGLQARGAPITPARDEALRVAAARGKALFSRRMGQLDLSCSGCHDDSWGKRLGSAIIPQGHPTGYPIYRLEWQGVGSLQRRLRNCMTGVRAEPYAYGAEELIELEAYLMQRAAGMPLETPAVRP